MSVESHRIRNAQLSSPSIHPEPIQGRTSTRASRAVLYLPSKHLRSLLSDYSQCGIDEEDFDDLYRKVVQRRPSIGKLMTLSSQKQGDIRSAHPKLKRFFHSCSKAIFPAICLIPKTVWGEVESVIISGNVAPESIRKIGLESPILSQFFNWYFISDTAVEGKQVCYRYNLFSSF